MQRRRGRSSGLEEAIRVPLRQPARLARVEPRALVRLEQIARPRAHALVGPALGADVTSSGPGAAGALVADAGVEACAGAVLLL